jgi:hypothetical protein
MGLLTKVGAILSDPTGQSRAGERKVSAGYEKAQSQMQPWVDFGKQYGIGGLEDLMKGRVDLFDQPGVSKSLNSGMDALQRKLSAQGMGKSGNELIDLADYTGNFSRNLYNDYFTQRMGIANMGMGSSQDLAGLYAGEGRDTGLMQYQRGVQERQNIHDVGMSAMSMIGGGGFCYVAEELYGKDSKKTKAIRKYVEAHEHDKGEIGEFLRKYKVKGPQWAETIKHNKNARVCAMVIWDNLHVDAIREGYAD